LAKKTFFLFISINFLPTICSLPAIPEDKPMVKAVNKDSDEKQKKEEVEETAKPMRILGSSYFMYHGQAGCMIHRGVGLRQVKVETCTHHPYYENSVGANERPGKLFLVFYDQDHQPVSSELVKPSDESSLLYDACAQLDPRAKPVAASAEIEMSRHKNLGRTITFKDKDGNFLARVRAPDSLEYPMSIVEHGKASLGNAIAYHPKIKISHAKAAANGVAQAALNH